MSIKGLLITLVIGTVVMASLNSVSMASPGLQRDPSKQMTVDAINEHMKYRLDKLSQRLEIRSSQQGAWEEYSRSVAMLAEHNLRRPNNDADAATIARYRADRAAEFAKKLTTIADATDKLQKVLTEDQRKIFNQVSRLALHKNHEWHQHRHGLEDGNRKGDK